MITAEYTSPDESAVKWSQDGGFPTFSSLPIDGSRGTGPLKEWLDAGNSIPSYTAPQPTSQDVDAERDRRLELVTFAGKVYDFDADSRQNISGAFALALAAIGNGAQVGDYRWADPDEDFTWIANDNTATLMDAPTTLAFGQVAASWNADHIRTARSIKDLDPIPTDYADDSRWPTA